MKVAGFWIRVLADLIDAIVLALVGWCIYLIVPSVVVRLGDASVLVGLLVSAGYATALTSHLGHGQTVGKRVTGLQVLTTTGEELSPARSLLRYSFVAFVFYVNSFQSLLDVVVVDSVEPMVAVVVTAVWVVAALGLSLMTAVHPAKRGLHDWVAGSVVIRKRHGFDPALFATLDRWPKERTDRVLIGLTGAALLVVIAATWIAPAIETKELSAMREGFEAMRGDDSLQVTGFSIRHSGFKPFNGVARNTTAIVVTARPRIAGDVSVNAPIVNRLFTTMREQIPEDLQADTVQVSVVTGFELGIAKRRTTTTFAENLNPPYDRRVVGTRTQF